MRACTPAPRDTAVEASRKARTGLMVTPEEVCQALDRISREACRKHDCRFAKLRQKRGWSYFISPE
jgi:hypothetical protein